jgi:8-oxo-dGTP diphosphatase
VPDPGRHDAHDAHDAEDDDEARFLATYDPTSYEQTAVTVDIVVLSVGDDGPAVLLVERGGHPFRGSWALPGGFLDPGDATLDAAARRELLEETGVDIGAEAWSAHFAQLGAYGDVGRDPRQRTVSVVFAGVVAGAPTPTAGSDAARAEVIPVRDLALDPASAGHVRLAFDHARIVRDAYERLGPELQHG